MTKKKLLSAGTILVLGLLLIIMAHMDNRPQDLPTTFANWENGIEIEEIQVDKEYMKYLEEYCDNLREEYVENVDYPNEKQELIPVDDIVIYRFFYESDGETVEGYLSLPVDYLEKKYPILVVNRGGHQDIGMLEPEVFYHLSRYGFIAVGTEYRGSANSTGNDEFCGSDVNDVIRIVDFAEQLSFASGKIYMLGLSRGAVATYIVLRQDDRIDAAVAGTGPTDMLTVFEEMLADTPNMAYVLGTLIGNPDYNEEKYIARSALCWADEINTPLYLVHGTEDEIVPYHHTEDLYYALQELGKEVKFKICIGQGHGTSMWGYIDDYVYWLKQH